MSEAPPLPARPFDAESASGIEDAAMRSAFGFDADDESWLAVVRRASAGGGTPSEPARLGPYRLLEGAAGGAQGTVYKAIQPVTNRTIAIKRLIAGSLAAPGARARFDREIVAVSALSHPCIVTVLGTDTVDGQPLLLMEWVDGLPIDRWATGGGQRKEPRSLAERLEVFAQVCDAVAHAHRRGIIHRDLKPSNILVVHDSASPSTPRHPDTSAPSPKVLDFGLARLIGKDHAAATVTHTGFVGTPAFAAPEQVAGRSGEIDTRTDVYGLGVVLYQMLTGRLPFQPGPDLGELFRSIREEDPRPPSKLQADVGAELDAITLKAMAKEPERRYQSVDALGTDLRRYIAGETVLAHPPSFLYQARKLVRRHRLPVTIGLAGSALVLTGAIVAGALSIMLAERGRQLSGALTRAQVAQHQATEQAQQAKESQQKAEEEAARSRANAEFLRDMLATLGLEVAYGQAKPPVEMLRQARARLESGELRDQPAAEATLWRTLGYTYMQCGMVSDAEQCIARAAALGDAVYGPNHPETGMRLLVEGLITENRRDDKGAAALYRRSAAILEAAWGRDHKETAHALNNLGCVLKDTGEHAESEAVHLRALDIRTRIIGERSREVATSLRNLGSLRRAQKRPDEAEDYYRRALAIATEACGPADPLIPAIRSHLAHTARERGLPEDSERMFRELVADMTRMHGAESRTTISALGGWCDTLARQGRQDEALLLYERAIAHYRETLPGDHLTLAVAMQNRGQWLLELRRYGEAEAALKEALTLAEGGRPARPDIERRITRLLARCQKEQQQAPGAVQGPPPETPPSATEGLGERPSPEP